MSPSSFVTMFLAFTDKLKFGNLFLIVVGLFVIDLFVPDFIPLIDEIILGLLAILLANWKKERREEIEGEVIEGEIVQEEDEDLKG
jgi:hypothetical protein